MWPEQKACTTDSVWGPSNVSGVSFAVIEACAYICVNTWSFLDHYIYTYITYVCNGLRKTTYSLRDPDNWGQHILHETKSYLVLGTVDSQYPGDKF